MNAQTGNSGKQRNSIRKKLFRFTFNSVLAAVIATDFFGSIIVVVEGEKKRREITSSIHARLITQGRMMVVNNCLAIGPMAAENGFSAVQELISASVKENRDVLRGIYMDRARLPWALVTPGNPGGVVSDKKQLDDSISLWADGLAAVESRTNYLGGEEVVEIAGPVMSGDERLGTIRYTMSTAAMRKSIDDLKKSLVVGGVVMAAVFSLVSILILLVSYRASNRQARAITGPLHDLTGAANTIAGGNYRMKVTVASDDEVGALAENFETMRRKVQEYTEDLEKKVAERTNQLQDALNKINEELLDAQRIQQALFPTDLGDSEKINVAAFCLPVGRVSGDLYDVVRLSPDRTLFAVLDVTGHGVPAALGTAMLKNSLVRHSHDRNVSPRELLGRINAEIINHVPKTQLVSAFAGIIDTGNMTFSFAAAGHPPALLLSPGGDGRVRQLRGKGLLMCVVPDLVVKEETVAVLPGDILYLCSDGLFDLFVKLNVRAGIEQMERFLLENRAAPVAGVVQMLSAKHGQLLQKGEVADDATVIGVQIKASLPGENGPPA